MMKLNRSELTHFLHDKVFIGQSCLLVTGELPYHSISEILSIVRAKLLSLTLDYETLAERFGQCIAATR